MYTCKQFILDEFIERHIVLNLDETTPLGTVSEGWGKNRMRRIKLELEG
jgi:hypothetical protein